VIRIYTEKRISPKKRAAIGIPARIRGVTVELMELGRPEISDSPADHQQKFRPLVGGISAVSVHQGSYGTLGYFVQDTAPPPPHKKAQWYILSNAHVLNTSPTGVETMQPGGGDGGKNPDDFVGKLTAYTYANLDAAIAKIDTSASAQILGLNGPYGFAGRVPVGLRVVKSGRTTGVTEGEIIDDHFVGNIDYSGHGTSALGQGIKLVSDCLLIKSTERSGVFLDVGDSGSLVLDDKSMVAVGLIFAQTVTARGAHRGIANKMTNVMKAFPDKRLVDPGTTWP
jgi:hypothetical protein